MSCSAALQALALPGAIQSWASGTDESVRMHVCVHVCLCVDKLPCCRLPVSSSYLSICRLYPSAFSLHCFFLTHVILRLLPLFLFL